MGVPAVAPVVTSTTGLVAHPNGAVTPDLTPAQKVATLNHYAAKGVVPLVHYGKRSAEAEADADAEADAYYGYTGYTGVYRPAFYGYGSRVYGYGHGYPYGAGY